MALQPLSTRLLLELLDFFEESGQGMTDADGQRLQGLPGWHVVGRTSLTADETSAWMERIGYVGSYPAHIGDERVAVDLEEDDEPGQYWYRSPETFRKKYVSSADAAVFAISAPKLLNQVATLLDIPHAQRKGIDTPFLDGALWHLGKARIGSAHTDIWFVRNLAARAAEVVGHFRSGKLPDQGLILSSGGVLPDVIAAPREYRVMSMREVLVAHSEYPCIDVDIIHRYMSSSSTGKPDSSLPVRFDPYSNTLVISTKSSKPWVIKGKRQVAVVRYLFEQFSNGRRAAPAGEILAAVYGSAKQGRSHRLQNIFSGNSFWEEYITKDENGNYGFLLN